MHGVRRDLEEVLAGKRLELLKETVPKLTRVAVLWNPQNRGNAQQWKKTVLPGAQAGTPTHSMEVSSAEQVRGRVRKRQLRHRSGALAVAQERVGRF